MKIKSKVLTVVLMLAVVVNYALGFSITACAEEPSGENNVEVSFVGTLDYEYAYDVLDLVNEEREAAGLEPLAMDQGLLTTAMQRAGEISIYYSHDRPDGSDCFTAFPSRGWIGENIAVGYSDPEDVMTGWMNSEGHKENILTEEFTCMGVGCFYQDGYIAWVQCFGSWEPTAVTGAQTGIYLMSTSTSSNLLTSDYLKFTRYTSDSYEFSCDESTQMRVWLTNAGWSYMRCELHPSTFDWSSSDTSVADVEEGLVTFNKGGKVTIEACIDSVPESAITYDAEAEKLVSDITLSKTSCTLYVGDTKTLKATVSPDDATNTAVRWFSTNSEVATVDQNGKITALSEGTTRVICSAQDGGEGLASCEVTVKPKESDEEDDVTTEEPDKEDDVTTGDSDKEDDVTTENPDKEDDVTTGDSDKEDDVTTGDSDKEDDVTTGDSDKEDDVTTEESDKEDDVTTEEPDKEDDMTTDTPGNDKADSEAKDGWVEIDGSWSYVEGNKKTTGWAEIDGTWYYFHENGNMAESQWIDGSYVDGSGAWIPNAVLEGWRSSGSGWWYQMSDGSYPVNSWLEISGEWYYFDAAGWLVTGWNNIGGVWYYMEGSGAMTTGWLNSGGEWYYMESSGAMTTGWNNINGNWYYLDGDGSMVTGWKEINETWYYMTDSGIMATGWVNDGGTWYYMDADGSMLTGIISDYNGIYFLDDTGALIYEILYTE